MQGSVGSKPNEVLATMVGKRLKSASSSLQNFVLEFEDKTGLLVEASGNGEDIELVIRLVAAADLPRLEEAVCSVDWSWITGSTIRSFQSSSVRLSFVLEPVGPLNISVGVWQGSAFLTFMPYRAPAT